MKTIFFSLLTIAALSLNLKAQEKPVVVEVPNVVVNTVLATDTIDQPADQDTSVIRIGNKEIQVIDHDHGTEYNWCSDHHKKDRSGKFNGHWEGFEMGFNGFDKADYSMYNAADKDFMSLNQVKSMEFDFNFYELNVGLIKSYVGIVSGMGLSFNSYRFENPYTLKRVNELTEPVLLNSEGLSKTKLVTSYLQVPLLLEFQIPVNQNEGRVYINAGIVGGVKLGSHTKVQYGNAKDKDHSGFNMNAFKYAATARIGYKNIGLFGTYSLTPLFESGKGPDLTPFTIGISLLN
ncbi:MAG TPA: hypothetical protein DCL77_16575 [Prolixibacteraceae bacterium]|jgi:hypothetical protein|nr:hypothetical protein [Prolixibacteraceae bacterium]